MTIGNLASGLIGAVLGGVIVVWAEQWRWRRENRAAARLVYYEAISNRVIIESLIKNPIAGFAGRLSRSVWDSQGVRVASMLRGDSLNTVGAAYLGIDQIVSLQPLLGDQKWEEWMAGEGKTILQSTHQNFIGSERNLTLVMNAQPWWRRPL